MTDSFTVKDSGARVDYPTGFRRDTEEGKPDITLVPREGLRRYAMHLTRGAAKYGADNWRLACTEEEMRRFQRSGFRHFLQWLDGERDEDHASAAKFNIDAAEYVRGILDGDPYCLEVLADARDRHGVPHDSLTAHLRPSPAASDSLTRVPRQGEVGYVPPQGVCP